MRSFCNSKQKTYYSNSKFSVSKSNGEKTKHKYNIKNTRTYKISIQTYRYIFHISQKKFRKIKQNDGFSSTANNKRT